MSGRPADFSRQGPGAGTARDHGIRFTREPAGNAAAVEKQLDAHLGQCGGLRQRTAAQRSPTPRRGSQHSEDSPPGRTGTGPRQGAPGSKPVFSSAPSWSGTSPRWRLLHNGYPVVHLAENTDLDISALARARLETGAPDLRTVRPYAERLTPRP